MKQDVLECRLAEIGRLLMSTSGGLDGPAPDGRYISHSPEDRSPDLEDLLTHIRLRAKYLVFDLEATRRENRYLRQMLERRSSSGEGTDPI